MTLTAKVQIFPSTDQIQALKTSAEAYKHACNFVSKYIFQSHNLSRYEVQKETYAQIRNQFGVMSQPACSVIRTVIATYRTIKSNNQPWTKPIFKIDSYDLVWNKDYSFTKDNLFSISTMQGRIKLPYTAKGMEQYFDGSWTLGTAKLVCTKNKFFLHIPVSKEHPDCSEFRNIAGVDLGINFLATSFNSKDKTKFYSGKQIKHKRAKYKKLRKELQEGQTASARRKLKTIGSRESRWMHDVNHCVSKALVESNPNGTLFVLEDLAGIRNATEKVRLKDRYVSVSWAFLDLRQKLEYKAQKYGSLVIAVDPKYTSQMCPKCGHTSKSNRNKKAHKFNCKACGYSSNDDRIGAMNLHRKGIEYLSAVISEQA